MSFFDIMQDVYGWMAAFCLGKTDEIAECEDSVFVTIDSGEIVFHSNLYNN